MNRFGSVLTARMLILKNKNVNTEAGLQGDRLAIKVGKSLYDKIGNRSGIRIWGFDKDKDLWFVKRKDNRMEYYNHQSDFTTWTKVDLTMLSRATFWNEHGVTKAWAFYNRLQEQVLNGFKDMRTAESMVKISKGVKDPSSKTKSKSFKSVVWPATRKLKTVPVADRYPDGSLYDLEFWCLDSESWSVIIKCADKEYRLMDIIDLLRFGEPDIKLLSQNQIKSDDIFETEAKQWTRSVAIIIENKAWAGSNKTVNLKHFRQ